LNQLILEQDTFIRSVDISRNDVFAVFLGAGASITSGIPSALDCIWDWKKNIYTSRHSYSPQKLDIKSDQVCAQIQQWLNSEGIFPAEGSNEEYSFFVEACYPIEADRRRFFQRICEKKLPSIGYKLLCLLHEMGIVQSVWTTNFDDLGIHAAIQTQVVPIDITLDTVDRIIRPQNTSELLFIKLHGDYKYGPLRNTATELATQDEVLREHLVDYLKDKHLIVSGYSGRDHSVMETLTQAYSLKGSGRLYWCGYGRDVPADIKELIRTAQVHGRDAFFIPTDGFDKLFISLATACAKHSDDHAQRLQQYLTFDAGIVENTHFTIPHDRTDTIIKSNFFPIGFPQEVFQFEYSFQEGDKPWSKLREMTRHERVVAVPFKKMVYAIGTLSDINRVFGATMQGKITRIALEGFNLQKDTAFHSLLMSGITDLLASRKGLASNKRDLIWKEDVVTQRMFNQVLYQTHPAIRLAINSDQHHHYLSFMPDFHISCETEGQQINREVRQEIGRTYFEKMRNNKFNDYLNQWRTLLFPSGSGLFDMEYPYSSGSGLVFKIGRENAFAGIMTPRPARYVINDQFPRRLILHRGIQYEEPELLFANAHVGMNKPPRDFHPMRGISANKPYDYEDRNVRLEGDTIRLAVICPKMDAPKFKTFLARHLTSVDTGGVNKAYLLPFPGFTKAFSTQLIVPDPGTENWEYINELELLADMKAIAATLRHQLIGSIDKLTRDGRSKVVVIYIPDRWLAFTSYDIDNEQYDLHDFIKAYCAERGIATQFIREDTLIDPLQCQINWWLSLSYFVKSLRTPWVLDSLDKNTAFAGIGYSVTSQGPQSEIVLGCSHIYNSRGQGLKYRLSKVEDQLFWDRHKRPHLSYHDAYKFGAAIIDMFYRTMDEFPKRVVIHKRTFFTADEIKGLKDSLLGSGINDVDLIEVNFEDDMRYLASKIEADGSAQIDNFALPRGTCVLLNGYEALLWSHGVVPSVENEYFKFYLGGRFIPGPLRIRKHFGNSDIGIIATEILGLTKMNWNSFDLYSQLPATVNSSNEIARIGRLLTKKEGVTYDYRYFI
jgi:hypothetical protein